MRSIVTFIIVMVAVFIAIRAISSQTAEGRISKIVLAFAVFLLIFDYVEWFGLFIIVMYPFYKICIIFRKYYKNMDQENHIKIAKINLSSIRDNLNKITAEKQSLSDMLYTQKNCEKDMIKKRDDVNAFISFFSGMGDCSISLSKSIDVLEENIRANKGVQKELEMKGKNLDIQIAQLQQQKSTFTSEISSIMEQREKSD